MQSPGSLHALGPGQPEGTSGLNPRPRAGPGWAFTCIDRGARARLPPPPARPLPQMPLLGAAGQGLSPRGWGGPQGRAREGEGVTGAKRKRDPAGLGAGTKRQERGGGSAEPLHEPRGAAPARVGIEARHGRIRDGRLGWWLVGFFSLFSQTANEQTPFPGNLGG